MTTLDALLRDAMRRLFEARIETPNLDSRLLAEDAFGLDAAGLILKGRDDASPDAQARLAHFVDRRLAGEPIHRIIGRRAFYAHTFELSPETLEPRPDTEILVGLAARAMLARSAASHGTFADVGTGSGAIAVSLLALFPETYCFAIDLSHGALSTARRNADAAGLGERFQPVVSDYLSAMAGPLELVVSNPPYIRSDAIATLSREVRDFDPHLALDGGADGLDGYRRLSAQCATVLSATGDALVEIGEGQAPAVAAIFAESGFILVSSARDLSGITRALWFRRPMSKI